MVYVSSRQINYQDAWILDGIVLPFVVLIGRFPVCFPCREGQSFCCRTICVDSFGHCVDPIPEIRTALWIGY